MPEDIEKTKNEEAEENEEPSGAETKKSSVGNGLFGPGIIFLFLGIILDIATLICVFLILFFGVGLLLAKVIYIIGLCIFIPWGLFISVNVKSSVASKKTMTKGLFKKMLPKLAGKLIPVIGDALPLWTWTAYDMLKSS